MIINQVQLGGNFFEVRPKIGLLLLDYKTSGSLSSITPLIVNMMGILAEAFDFFGEM